MEPRHFSGTLHGYHATQSHPCTGPVDAASGDPLLIDIAFTPSTVQRPAFHAARALAVTLLPDAPTASLPLYDRLSAALTVAQVTGVQRLCSYYAARLFPLSCPDSSRESNNRLTQLTQYARQLAMQPALVDGTALTALMAAGLTMAESVTLTQIVGFVSYQARLIAGLQALQGQPVRWLPGIAPLPECDTLTAGSPCVAAGVPPDTASAEQRQAVAGSLSVPFSTAQRWRLAHDAPALGGFARLYSALPGEPAEESALMAAICARITGYLPALARWQGNGAAELRESVAMALAAADRQDAVLIDLAVQLTRQPAACGAAHLQPLADRDADTLLILVQHCALANWESRLGRVFSC